MIDRRPGAAKAAVLLLALAGCSAAEGPERPATKTTVQVVPAKREPIPPLALPDEALLSADEVDETAFARTMIDSFEAYGLDVRAVVLTLAKLTPYNVVVDPSLEGEVQVHLRKIDFLSALDLLLKPYGYTYRRDGRLIEVYKPGLVSRTFRLDYLNVRRSGESRLNVEGASSATRQLQLLQSSSGFGSGGFGGSTGGGFGGGFGGGGSGFGNEFEISTNQVTTRTDARVWERIENEIRAIVFGAEAKTASSGVESTTTIGGGIASTTTSGGGGQLFPPLPTPDGMADAAGRRVIVDPVAGIVLVKALPDEVDEVEHFLETFRRSVQKQVMIKAKIIEVRLTDEFQFGINWDYITDSAHLADTTFRAVQTLAPEEQVFRFLVGNDHLQSMLDLLQRNGDVEVLSSPRILTLSNQKAIIKTGREDTFFIRNSQFFATGVTTEQNDSVLPLTVTIGVVLDVTPQVGEKGDITLHVRPSITEFVEEKIFPPGATGTDILASAPILDVREVDTVTRLREGQTLVIGGIMRDERELRQDRIPFVSDIPLLGYLFTKEMEKKRKIELVIFLQPFLVDRSNAAEYRHWDVIDGWDDPAPRRKRAQWERR